MLAVPRFLIDKRENTREVLSHFLQSLLLRTSLNLVLNIFDLRENEGTVRTVPALSVYRQCTEFSGGKFVRRVDE